MEQPPQAPLSRAVLPTDLLPICYGAVRVGGTNLSFHSDPGSDLKHALGLIVFCEGKIEAVDSVICNGFPLPMPFTNDYLSFLYGTSPDGAGLGVTNVACVNFDILTTAQGLSWWNFLPAAGGGFITTQDGTIEWAADLRGFPLYDPRLDSTNGGSGSQRYATPSTWIYSNNPALIVRDILKRYVHIPDALLDDVGFAAAAAACTSIGFTCNITFATKTLLRDALALVLQTCNGKIITSGGKTGLYLDVPNADPPVASVSEEDGDIWGLHYEWISARDRYTQIAVSFMNSAADYKQDQTPFFGDPGTFSSELTKTISFVNTGTDTLTMSSSPGWAVNDTVWFSQNGGDAIPGLPDGQTYFVKTISGADITLALAVGGATIDLTGSPTITTQYLQRVGIAYPPTMVVKQQVVNAPGINTLPAAVILRDYLYNLQANAFRISGMMNAKGITLQQGQKIHLTTLKGVDADCHIEQITSDATGFFPFVVKPYDSGTWGTTPISQPPPVVTPPPNPTSGGEDITVTDTSGTRQVTMGSASNVTVYDLYQLIVYTLPTGGAALQGLRIRGFRGTGAGSKTWEDMIGSDIAISLTGNEPPPDATHSMLSMPGVVKTIRTLTFDAFGRLQNTTTATGPTRIIIKTVTTAGALSTGVTVDVGESSSSVDESNPPADIGRGVIIDWADQTGGTITGAIDGVNPDFVLSQTPSSARILLVADAQNVWGRVDYTRVVRDIHFTDLANKPSQTLMAVYPYGQPVDPGNPEGPPPGGPPGMAATWEQGTAPAHAFIRMAFSPTLNLFAAIYAPTDGSLDVVATSPDGLTWTEQTTPAGSSLPWSDICWGNGQFLIVCVGSITPGKTLTSPDGVNWTLNTITGLTGYQEMTRVIWLGSQYLAMKTGGTCDTFTSADGLAWVQYSDIGQANDGVCYSPELGMLVAVQANWIMTSVDGGSTWTHQTDTPAITSGPRGAAWSSDLGLFVTCANDQFLTSPNGVNWTERTSSHSGGYASVDVAWSHVRHLFIAVGGTIRTSPDGTNWTEQTCGNTSLLVGIAVDEGRDIIAVIGNCAGVYPNNVFRSLA